jgi:hypothetical protein
LTERVEAMRPIVEGAARTMARAALRFCQVDENSAVGDEGAPAAEVNAQLARTAGCPH